MSKKEQVRVPVGVGWRSLDEADDDAVVDSDDGVIDNLVFVQEPASCESGEHPFLGVERWSSAGLRLTA